MHHRNGSSQKNLMPCSSFCLKEIFLRLLSSGHPANTTFKKMWFCTHSFSSWGDATGLRVSSGSCSSSFASCFPLDSGLIWSVPIFSVVLRTKLETLGITSSNIKNQKFRSKKKKNKLSLFKPLFLRFYNLKNSWEKDESSDDQQEQNLLRAWSKFILQSWLCFHHKIETQSI